MISWQSDLENTEESILPVCDKPYHKIEENMPLGEELEKLWNYSQTWINVQKPCQFEYAITGNAEKQYVFHLKKYV